MHPWTWPSEPWKRVHIDFAGPFLGKMYFLAIDAHSKWPEVFEMNQTTTARTITVLRHLFATYGLPDQIVSDNGPQFTAEDFAAFMQANGVRHIRCSPYHPSSNGAVERFVRTFKQTMTAGNRDGRTTQHRLENFLLSYRTVPHATTKVAPCTLFLGRSIRTRFDLLKPNLERQVCEKQAAQKLHHDKEILSLVRR
jgi:transposase InsO family protein